MQFLFHAAFNWKEKKFHLHLIYIFFMACIVVKLAILVFNARMVLLFANGLFFSFFPFWQPGHCEPPSHWCLNTMPGTHQRLCFVNTNVLFSFFLLSFAAGYFLFFFLCFPSRQLGICTGAATYWCSSSPWEVILWREPFRWRSPYCQGKAHVTGLYSFVTFLFSFIKFNSG